MLTREEQLKQVSTFVRDYHIKKVISGEGLESKRHWYTNPITFYLQILLFVAGITVGMFTDQWIAIIPGILLAVASYLRIEPKNLFYLNFRRELERLENFELLFQAANERIGTQIDEIDRASLTKEEMSALYQFALMAPIFGKERTREVLPGVLDRNEGLRMLSFMQEVASDLRVGR